MGIKNDLILRNNIDRALSINEVDENFMKLADAIDSLISSLNSLQPTVQTSGLIPIYKKIPISSKKGEIALLDKDDDTNIIFYDGTEWKTIAIK